MKYRITDSRSKESWTIETRARNEDKIVAAAIGQIRWTNYPHMVALELKDNLCSGYVVVERI